MFLRQFSTIERIMLKQNLLTVSTRLLSGKRHNKDNGKKRSKRKKTSQKQTEKSKTNIANTASTSVPPAYLVPTASKNVYVASCACEEFEIDPQTLFVDVVASQRHTPHSFRHTRFEYVSPNTYNWPNFPKWDIPEVAFLGRSNVGKSSLINSLTKSDLARTSKTPGRTQQVNYFALVKHSKWNQAENGFDPAVSTGFLVDLPGYGYAKAPGVVVEEWQKKTQDFLLQRTDSGHMKNVFVLVDSRRGMTPIDQNIMMWFDEAEIPYTMVMTKADKVGKPQQVRFANEICMRYHHQLYRVDDQNGNQAPIVHITSSSKNEGIRELMSSIDTDFASKSEEGQ